MSKTKKSGPAIFMYSVIAACIAVFTVCFVLYYTGTVESSVILWVGITAFTITYHFWGRILLGDLTKHFKIDHNKWWFREKKFEKKLYKLLRVRRWKEKVLTFDPESFNVEKHSLEEIAATMTKAETDHWINEILSLTTLLFPLLWGELWIFALTAFFAMIFDAQFIVVQRYNRPKVLRLIARKKARAEREAKV